MKSMVDKDDSFLWKYKVFFTVRFLHKVAGGG